IINVIKTHKVEELTLVVGRNVTSDKVQFLFQLSSHIRSLHILQQRIKKSDMTHYFLGINGAEWSPIILEMFSKKLDKLFIDNCYYPAYLSDQSIDQLNGELPILGKKLLFSSSCLYPKGLNYMDNDHTVMVTKSAYPDRLNIIHSSRKHEQLEP
ncbi:hypothetical protein PENTCL1PPCAC_7518, partial [Pristionchus entomophagus]